MKIIITTIAVFLSTITFCSAQWTEWFPVHSAIQVSFLYGKKGTDYSWIRFKNVSNQEFAHVRVEFDIFNKGMAEKKSFSVFDLKPQVVLDSKGNWFNTDDGTQNVRLIKLVDKNQKDVLNGSMQQSGVNEIYFPKKESTPQKKSQDDLESERRLRSWQEQEKRKEAALNTENAIAERIKEQQSIKGKYTPAKSIQQPDPSQQFAEQQRRFQQTQHELDEAKNVSMAAYQSAVNGGRRESGAMLDATLAGAEYINDPTSKLVYTGVGLAVSLLSHLGEKRQEKLEKVEVLRREEIRKEAIIVAKEKFIGDAVDINKYVFADLISKERYAAVMLVPKKITSSTQAIHFSSAIKIPKYGDNTYPLKDVVEKELISTIDRPSSDFRVITLYPITNVENFETDFVKKMGSGELLYFNTEVMNLNKVPFKKNNNVDINFGDNPNRKKEIQPTKTENDFWNN